MRDLSKAGRRIVDSRIRIVSNRPCYSPGAGGVVESCRNCWSSGVNKSWVAKSTRQNAS
jgi:hypothetical protein